MEQWFSSLERRHFDIASRGKTQYIQCWERSQKISDLQGENMKRLPRLTSLLLLLAAIIFIFPSTSAQGSLAPDGVAGLYYFAPFPVTIELDGELDDWAGVPTVSVPFGATEGPAMTFGATADADNLYMFGDVLDDNIISGEHDVNYWNEDSIEFYINATGDFLLTGYTDGVVQMTFPPINATSDEPIISGVRGSEAGATFEMVITETGYRVEVAVPLRNDIWTISPAHGGVIGFQVHVNSASESNRDGKLIWSALDTADQSYQNPSVFGYLAFFEVGNSEIPDVETTIAQLTLPPEANPLFVPVNAAYKNPLVPIDERVADLMARMTLEEKIGQMTLVEKNSIQMDDIAPLGIGALLSGGGGYPRENTPEAWARMVNNFQAQALESRLGIPLLYGVDAVHGHSNVEGAVIFPHNIGLGAANNPELVEEVCRVTAQEMIATGIYWNYSPAVPVLTDIRWGRTYEGYSEDTDIVATLGAACVRGLQGDDLSDPFTVLATPKHFVGDGGTVWGTSTTDNYLIDQGVTLLSEEELREIHLPPYLTTIDDGAMSIMASYSSWNETKMHAQAYLMNDVLKGELGFEGFIVSDWAAIDQITPEDYYASVVAAINAGIDMNMVPYDYNRFIATMLEAVENGDISMERIDNAVERILRIKFELGLFEWPYSQEFLLEDVGSEAHRAVAREAVSQSLVLLKNEGDAAPLDAEAPLVFLAGDGVDDIGMQSGGWTIEWQGALGDITEGTTIREAVEAAVSPDTEVFYDVLGRFRRATDDNGEPLQGGIGIVVVGEVPYAEGRGDSEELVLQTRDLTIIQRVRERVDTLVVVLLSGRPLVVNDVIDMADVFVAAWLPGTEGAGVTDALFGDQPFVGTLPVTWPASLDQLGTEMEDPLFPLGFGLTTD